MQVVIGGAYNGKGNYVRALLAQEEVYYFDGELPTITYPAHAYVVISNFEQLLAPLQALGEVEAASTIYDQLTQIEAQLICVCTDMSRGVVPLDATARFVRDASGRLYQRLFQGSSKVVRVWYGLAETLKEEL